MRTFRDRLTYTADFDIGRHGWRILETKADDTNDEVILDGLRVRFGKVENIP